MCLCNCKSFLNLHTVNNISSICEKIFLTWFWEPLLSWRFYWKNYVCRHTNFYVCFCHMFYVNYCIWTFSAIYTFLLRVNQLFCLAKQLLLVHTYLRNRKRVTCVYGVIMHAENVRGIREGSVSILLPCVPGGQKMGKKSDRLPCLASLQVTACVIQYYSGQWIRPPAVFGFVFQVPPTLLHFAMSQSTNTKNIFYTLWKLSCIR